jgi:hypothetical protein
MFKDLNWNVKAITPSKCNLKSLKTWNDQNVRNEKTYHFGKPNNWPLERENIMSENWNVKIERSGERTIERWIKKYLGKVFGPHNNDKGCSEV